MTDGQWEDLLRIIDGQLLDPLLVGFLADGPWFTGINSIGLMDYFADNRVWLEANLNAVQVREAVPVVVTQAAGDHIDAQSLGPFQRGDPVVFLGGGLAGHVEEQAVAELEGRQTCVVEYLVRVRVADAREDPRVGERSLEGVVASCQRGSEVLAAGVVDLARLRLRLGGDEPLQ